MKQNIDFKTKANSRNRVSADGATAGINRTTRQSLPDFVVCPITISANVRSQEGGLRVGYGREGPPGRARSPGTTQTMFPDNPTVICPDGVQNPCQGSVSQLLNFITMKINTLINNKYQILTTNFLTIKF
jgi:hypothetical protein